jgi:hypothetical protein
MALLCSIPCRIPSSQARPHKPNQRCTNPLLPHNLGSFFPDRHCILTSIAFVRVELLVNSRLPQLTRICRELRIARFTDSQRRDVADSFHDPKTALCHVQVSHSPGKCATTAGVECQVAGVRKGEPESLFMNDVCSETQSDMGAAAINCSALPRNRTFSLFKRPCSDFRAYASLPSLCCGNSCRCAS